ncbi:MBL fold metallo-hydrolase [Halolamina litorea]|uniref:MBL fold metallo-hydrolase n=1 Tax=Halolamina litorea TaxID=1515593 RepID=A0ABD6BRA1_9EURY|nr:MBL fold metallo-hydrolase [Halolamina litorea]
MTTAPDIEVQLVRNATLLATVDGTTFLVDPMLSPQGANPPIQNTPNDRNNPLVALPEVDLDYDAVVVTHRHPDHWDEAASEELADDVPLLCQPEEADAFVEEGFTDVRPVEDETTFEGITIHRTPGRHGHDELAEQMGPVSGFVFENGATLYVAGDTVWYEPVAETLAEFDPVMAVLNGGEARFEEGEPITMGVDDVRAVREATDATVAVVHMEAINHCLLSREELRAGTEDVLVPEDGERVSL